MIIELTESELLHAATVGVRRQIGAIRRQAKDRVFAPLDPWDVAIEGALGECATARYLGWYWKPDAGEPYSRELFKAPDVGPYQVRTAKRDLVIRPGDADDSLMCLARGCLGRYRIIGWIIARDAKRRDDWKEARHGYAPAWFVPDTALRSFDDNIAIDLDIVRRDRAQAPR